LLTLKTRVINYHRMYFGGRSGSVDPEVDVPGAGGCDVDTYRSCDVPLEACPASHGPPKAFSDLLVIGAIAISDPECKTAVSEG